MWRNGMIFWFSFFLTVTLLSVGYALIGSGWTPPSTLEVGVSSTLSAGAWNNLLANFNNLDARTTSLNNWTAKAWVNFNGTSCSPNCTIRASYNISSITRNSVGAYTVTLATPLIDSNYIVTGTVEGNASYNWWLQTSYQIPRTTTQFQVASLTSAGAAIFDNTTVNVAVFR